MEHCFTHASVEKPEPLTPKQPARGFTAARGEREEEAQGQSQSPGALGGLIRL